MLDEAHYLSLEAHTALMPTTSARDYGAVQVWYAASAVDEEVHEHGLVLARIRERALSPEAAGLAYTEWSADLRDAEGNELRPEEVTPEMVDEDVIAAANPALGARISIEHVRLEREAMSWRGWLTERVGVGAWPDTSGVASAPVTGEEWNELANRGSEVVGEVVLAFDIGPDRRTALVACGRRGADDLLHLELLDSRPGTGWLVERLEYLNDRHDVREVVADDYGGNRAMLKTLADAGLNVRAVPGTEHVAACATLLDLVAERGFRHLGQLELLAALKGAKAKPVGDAWVWSRRASSGDAALVIAMTLALAAGAAMPVEAWEPRIY